MAATRDGYREEDRDGSRTGRADPAQATHLSGRQPAATEHGQQEQSRT
ncbi:MAG: hypothetical protein QOF82_1913, partial [Frankiales bacterium]|nr:hypothetical protein [Frankiales bacterium]